jgi:hypothetical protein
MLRRLLDLELATEQPTYRDHYVIRGLHELRGVSRGSSDANARKTGASLGRKRAQSRRKPSGAMSHRQIRRTEREE